MRQNFKFWSVVLIFAFCILNFTCYAQDNTDVTGGAKTILDYKNELNLTSEQVTRLEEIISRLKSYLTEKRKSFVTLQMELSDMFSKKENLKLIRLKLEQIAGLGVDMYYRQIATSRELEDILTPAQLEKWQNIKKDYIKKLQSQAIQKK